MIIRSTQDLCVLKVEGGIASVFRADLNLNPRPLLIGSTVVASRQTLVITGGSAVCFSFGTYWNKGCYNLFGENAAASASSSKSAPETWTLTRTVAAQVPKKSVEFSGAVDPAQLVSVARVRLGPSTDFDQIVQAGTPTILENMEIGPCVTAWTKDYLKEKVGTEREVGVCRPKKW